MKAYDVTGRVVSHSLFQPNPKDYPELELARIVLSLSPATSNADKHTKAVLVVEKDSIFEDLMLGRMLVLTVREHPQQDLFMPNGQLRADETKPVEGSATLEFTDPETGQVMKADFTPEKLEQAASNVRARRQRAGRQIERLAKGGRGRTRNTH